ncbi:uncharacterized protein DSM5745_10658 [Aspergillus mulundensis]|uniref:Uncharacterized protein n=1 Tax=Aspergillus mulundensis TaxID=1810919 RepID=A0A3D8QHL5_9EURO|nr:hypothetical protein DSM5745_10658 [Aspergillus mulundensis]RDW61160.1 hypothetical protein DSM5745_10658 [Aspergillus mulundensis]
MPTCPDSSSPSCNFHCPAGGTWYACPDQPYFVGCCSSDPCTGISPRSTSPCPENGTYPASFNPAIFDSFLPNTCIGAENAHWYTCNFTTPPFLGCCLKNPCAEGNCSAEDLVQAAWSDAGGNKNQYELFRDEAAGSDELSGGAIAGIVIGAVAALGIVLALGWLCMRRRRRRKNRTPGDPHGQTPSDGGLALLQSHNGSTRKAALRLVNGLQPPLALAALAVGKRVWRWRVSSAAGWPDVWAWCAGRAATGDDTGAG